MKRMRRSTPEGNLSYVVSDLFGEKDRQILRLALSSGISQGDVDSAIEGWNTETAPIQTVMLLAFLTKNHPECDFPEELLSSLQVVLKRCRGQYLKVVSHFSKAARSLHDAGVPFAVIKGGAMKVLRPDFPRWMSDIDILVPETRFDEAVKIVAALGYDSVIWPHAADFKIPGNKEGVIDIHRYIKMKTGSERAVNEGVFQRAREVPMYSTEGLLPCNEDLVFIILVNLYYNIITKTSANSSVCALFDIQYLSRSKEGFDWKIVIDDAVRTGSVEQLYLLGKIADRMVPGIFPERFLEDESDKEKAWKMCRWLVRNRKEIVPLRNRIRECPVGWKYLIMKIKLFFLKRIPV